MSSSLNCPFRTFLALSSTMSTWQRRHVQMQREGGSFDVCKLKFRTTFFRASSSMVGATCTTVLQPNLNQQQGDLAAADTGTRHLGRCQNLEASADAHELQCAGQSTYSRSAPVPHMVQCHRRSNIVHVFITEEDAARFLIRVVAIMPG